MCVEFVYLVLCMYLVLVVVVIGYCSVLFSIWVWWVVGRSFVWASSALVCPHWLCLDRHAV